MLYCCDQGISDTMLLADIASNTFLSDKPNVRKLYAKSKNASRYHSNYAVEAPRFLCKYKAIKLVRHNYKEPCREKDQCDGETVSDKSLTPSYIDAPNNLLS